MPRDTKLVEPDIMRRAVGDSFVKLNPRTLMRNPVMFVVGVGAVLTTVLFFKDLGSSSTNQNVFTALVTVFLWFTVLFANFAEAIAEGRGKAQADTLRKTRSETLAHRRRADGGLDEVPSTQLDVGDEVVVSAGEMIPSDGEVIEGIASVDESAITGESAPVIRESGGDRSAVTGGTRVLSDEIVVRITARAGETFLDRMIALVEGSSRQKTPNEIALNILLAGLTIIFLLTTVSLQPFAMFANAEQSVVILVALLVCLIPTTIGALLSAIGIAGMDRLVRRNVLAMSGRAVEAAGDCATLLLDKTGTITFGNRQADAFMPVNGVTEQELADAAQLSSLADETPEGRSIVVLAKDRYGLRGARAPRRRAGAVHRADPHERRRLLGPVGAQGRGRLGAALGRGERRCGAARARRCGRLDLGPGRDAPRGRRNPGNQRQYPTRPRPWRDLPQGHRQARHLGTLRRPAAHGHPHGDDHRRQPAHRRRDRARSGRRRLPRRSDA